MNYLNKRGQKATTSSLICLYYKSSLRMLGMSAAENGICLSRMWGVHYWGEG